MLEVNSHCSCSVEGFQEVHLITSIQQTAELFPRPGSVLRAGDATVREPRHICVSLRKQKSDTHTNTCVISNQGLL